MSAIPRKISFGTAPKYHNKPTVRLIAGKAESFPSLLESRAYATLVLMERAGKIRNLTRERKACTFEMKVGGKLICRYIADFIFDEERDGSWHPVVADAKGNRTPVYKLKKKLMAACLGIEIREL
jgi:hypothetical protein